MWMVQCRKWVSLNQMALDRERHRFKLPNNGSCERHPIMCQVLHLSSTRSSNQQLLSAGPTADWRIMKEPHKGSQLSSLVMKQLCHRRKFVTLKFSHWPVWSSWRLCDIEYDTEWVRSYVHFSTYTPPTHTHTHALHTRARAQKFTTDKKFNPMPLTSDNWIQDYYLTRT